MRNLLFLLLLLSLLLKALIEKGSAAVSCDANRTRTYEFFFIKFNNLDLLAL